MPVKSLGKFNLTNLLKMVRYNELKGLYEVEKTIGCGGFAKVKLAIHSATGEKVAIKIMDKTGLGDDLPRVKLELKALKSFSHQHICKLYQVIETETHFFLIMEYCSGGELFDHIVEKTRLTESESRTFFRQIVSAVAYLHSLGYAHRDLKPENVLLDKDQNLKLIDFGLCARPDGGIKSLLFTSCGSPTYAAPELVLGKEYLGPEVDVWAMGVLLYALLVGSLPFDDLNIDSLYKKILVGRYDEPAFLSQESKRLIKSMLQVDPKKRITVTQLLSHQWLTLGFLEPVDYKSIDLKVQDPDCINVLASYCNVPPEKMWRYIKLWKYDYCTASYLLLLSRKRRGLSLKLNTAAVNLHLKPIFEEHARKIKSQLKPLNVIETRKIDDKFNNENDPATPKTPYYDCVCADIENIRPLNGKIQDRVATPARSVQRTQKRARSPTLASEGSPREVFKAWIAMNWRCHNRPAMADETSATNQVLTRDPSGILRPSSLTRGSLHSSLHTLPAKKATTRKSTTKTPDRRTTTTPPVTAETPGSARRVLCTIERSLNKVRHVLTPKKPQVENTIQPVVLSSKNLCNVSTTQCNDPEYVITELSKAFQKKGFHCERKGFILSGKVEANVLHHCSGCSFQLEICYLPRMGPPAIPKSQNYETPPKSILKNGPLNNCSTPTSTPTNRRKHDNRLVSDVYNKDKSFAFVGIRRKRLKGDSWCYKKVCEEVLAVATKDLRQVTESVV